MIKACYMCDGEATSREHVPPKCIFPEKKDLPKNFDFRKNLISVPSCDEHNSHKSKDDEYFMFILSCAFQGNGHQLRHFATKVMRAFQRRPHVCSSFMKNFTPVNLVSPEGKKSESAAFQIDRGRFDRIVKNLSCGIYYHHLKENWRGEVHIFTNAFLESNSPDSPQVNEAIQKINTRLSKTFSGVSSVGSNEDIFHYKMVSASTINGDHAIHIVFYEGVEITVLLKRHDE